MKKQIHFFILTGWLIPAGTAIVLMARWIREILVPTLKGGNFEQLYDLHGIRYLDLTLFSATLAFTWMTIAVVRWARKQANLA
jgi:hypothetical protein